MPGSVLSHDKSGTLYYCYMVGGGLALGDNSPFEEAHGGIVYIQRPLHMIVQNSTLVKTVELSEAVKRRDRLDLPVNLLSSLRWRTCSRPDGNTRVVGEPLDPAVIQGGIYITNFPRETGGLRKSWAIGEPDTDMTIEALIAECCQVFRASGITRPLKNGLWRYGLRRGRAEFCFEPWYPEVAST